MGRSAAAEPAPLARHTWAGLDGWAAAAQGRHKRACGRAGDKSYAYLPAHLFYKELHREQSVFFLRSGS